MIGLRRLVSYPFQPNEDTLVNRIRSVAADWVYCQIIIEIGDIASMLMCTTTVF